MKTISVAELKQRLDEQTVVLVDVREPAEHRSERIEGAHSIPLSECCLKKIPSTAQPIVIHCRSGKRSLEACRRLLQENPQIDVCSLEGGISAWEQAGFPVERAKNSVLPLDQQTQLVAGFLAFSGVMLSFLFNPWFSLLSGFVGLGLMFAGITGWCGMAKLLAKMPWNQ